MKLDNIGVGILYLLLGSIALACWEIGLKSGNLEAHDIRAISLLVFVSRWGWLVGGIGVALGWLAWRALGGKPGPPTKFQESVHSKIIFGAVLVGLLFSYSVLSTPNLTVGANGVAVTQPGVRKVISSWSDTHLRTALRFHVIRLGCISIILGASIHILTLDLIEARKRAKR